MMNKEIYKTLFIAYLVGLLFSINIFFAIFVHNPNDLTPNLALLFVTVPPMFVLIFEIFKKKSKGGTKNAKIN